MPTTEPKGTALSAYENNGVVIVETGKGLWITTIVGILVLSVAIGFGIYVAFKYPAENEDDEDVKRVITGNKVLSCAAGTFIFVLIIWYAVAMFKRSKNWDNERLEDEAATLFAHAYGERAKKLAVDTGGEKLTGFKDQMYGHLKSVFSGKNMEATKGFFRSVENSEAGGAAAANQAAGNIGNAIGESVSAAARVTAATAAGSGDEDEGGDAATLTLEQPKSVAARKEAARQEAARREAARREAAATAAETATVTPTGGDTGVEPATEGGGGGAPPIGTTAIFGSPSSLKKKKKASPVKKRKPSPTKKKSTSSRRK